MLEIAQEIECEISETPPSLIPFKNNLSCELAARGGRYPPKYMFTTSLNCRLNAITLFGCVTKRLISCALFMDATLKATKAKQILKALT